METPPGVMRRAYRYLPVLLKGRPLHDEARYRPFFIIGSGRCGTTLLRAMLQTHPAVHIPPETYVLGTLIKEYRLFSRLPWDAVIRLILSRLEYADHFDTHDISLRLLYYELIRQPRDVLNLAFVLDRFYRFHAETHKPSAVRWGDKTPLNTNHLDEIRRVFPDALFIHLVRDGRDVVRSLMEMKIYDLREAAALWSKRVRTAMDFEQRYPTQYLEIRYEALVTTPEMVIKRICSFLGLEFRESMLRHDELGMKLGDVEKHLFHANIKNPINPEAIGRWVQYFGESELGEVERALSPLLQELGYELSDVQRRRCGETV